MEIGKWNFVNGIFIDELKCNPFRARLKYAFSLKTDEEVKAAEVLRADTLKMEDYNELDDIMGEKDKTVDKLNDDPKSKADQKTGMEEVKERLNQEDEEEEEKRPNSNSNKDQERDRSQVESKHEFGKDEDEEEDK